MKIVKIAVGSALAIILANLFQLEYSTAAGIITLLTIQDTKKDTIQITLKRLVAFCLATLLSLGIFNVFGFTAVSFGIFLLVFIWICYAAQFQDTIAMNAVLMTHYLLAGTITASLIGNELILLVIGAGVGTLLNLYMPDNMKQIRNTQDIIETDLKKVLSRMSAYILKDSREDYTGDCFDVLNLHIQEGIRQAYVNMNNNFMQDNQYFLDYMQMRKQQNQILKNIYKKIVALDHIPAQANDIADFINHISQTLSETNNASDLLAECNSLFEKFQKSELPVTRKEFEARAILYMLMKDFEYFLQTKQVFADSLSDQQKEKYWGE